MKFESSARDQKNQKTTLDHFGISWRPGQELELRGGQPGANFNVSLDLLSQDQDWMKHDETAEIDRNSWNVGENWHDFNLLWPCLGYCPQMFFPPPFLCRAPMREVILRRSSSSWQLLITNAGTGCVPKQRGSLTGSIWFPKMPKISWYLAILAI